MTPDKILLVHVPNIRRVTDNPEPYEVRFVAMGLFAMAEYLSRHSFPVEIVNLATELRLDPQFDLSRYVREQQVSLVAMSLQWAMQCHQTLKAAEEIKRVSPHVPVLLGGMTASFYARQILESYPCVDYVLKGDGEKPLLELIRRLKGQGSLQDVPNLLYRQGDTVVENALCYTAVEEDLNALIFSEVPFLKNYQSYLDTLPFRGEAALAPRGFFPLSTGRGCSFNCNYCGGSALAQFRISGRRKFIYREPERVIRDIKRLLEYGVQDFYVCFDPDPDGPYYYRLFELIRRERLKVSMNFGAWGLPSREFIRVFKETFQSGIIEISPESGVESVRRKNKDTRLFYTNRQMEDALRGIEDDRFMCFVYFAYSLHEDSLATIRETMLYMRNLRESFSSRLYYLTLSSDPGALLQLHPEKFSVNYRVSDPKALSAWIQETNDTYIIDNAVFHTPCGVSNEDYFVQQSLYPTWASLERIYPDTWSILLEQLGGTRLMETLESELLRAHYRRTYQSDFDGNVTLSRDGELFHSDHLTNFLVERLHEVPASCFPDHESLPGGGQSLELPLILRRMMS